MFFLPLPVGKTLETLHSIEDGQTQSLPDPELYIILNGKPTKNKVVWQKLVDVNRVKKAFHKLKEINWLYKATLPKKSLKFAIVKLLKR